MPCASAILAALRPGYASLPRYCPGGQYARPFFLDSHGIDALGGHFPPTPKATSGLHFLSETEALFQNQDQKDHEEDHRNGGPTNEDQLFSLGQCGDRRGRHVSLARLRGDRS